MNASPETLRAFLENNPGILSWNERGHIVLEIYEAKKFRALGGDVERLAAFFGESQTLDEAARKYIAAIRREL